MTVAQHYCQMVESISNLASQQAMPGYQQMPAEKQALLAGQLLMVSAQIGPRLKAAAEKRDSGNAGFLQYFHREHLGASQRILAHTLAGECPCTKTTAVHAQIDEFLVKLDQSMDKQPVAILGVMVVAEILSKQLLCHAETRQAARFDDNIVMLRRCDEKPGNGGHIIDQLAIVIEQLPPAAYQAVFAVAVQFLATIVDMMTALKADILPEMTPSSNIMPDLVRSA